MVKRIFGFVMIAALLFSAINVSAQEEQGQSVSKKALRLIKKVDKAIESQEYDKALEFCQKAIESEPAYPVPHFKKGFILKEQQKYGEAAGSFEKALQLQPQYPEAKNELLGTLNLLAKEMMTNKDPLKANELYLKIVGFQDVDEPGKRVQTEAYYKLGVNYYSLKKSKESNEYFIKFIGTPGAETDYRDSFITANYIVGINSYQLKLPEQSNEYLLRFLGIDKEKQNHLQWMPLAHFIVGSNGFDLLRKAVDQKDKTDVEGVAKLAKEDKIIVTHLSKALELGLNLEQIYLTLGNYYYYCRDLKSAIVNYKLLVEKFPGSPDISSYNDFLKQLEEDKKNK